MRAPVLGQIRKSLIEKILSIKNKDIISSIDKLLETMISDKDVYKVNEYQLMVLEANEEDIKRGDLINDEDVNQEENTWLNE